jgi:hypothetical protein
MGWKILFTPSVLVKHYHESTIGSLYNSDYIRMIAIRNQYIFFWKNIDDISMWVLHIANYFLSIFKALVKLDGVFLKAIFFAKCKGFKILLSRFSYAKFIIKDQAVLKLFRVNNDK